jgi:hypothetical protein
MYDNEAKLTPVGVVIKAILILLFLASLTVAGFLVWFFFYGYWLM